MFPTSNAKHLNFFQYTSTYAKKHKLNGNALTDHDIHPILSICKGAKEQLCATNFEADWGLYNGAVGTIKEFVYNRAENPLDGTLPKYPIVCFPHYCGPCWCDDHPIRVPIPHRAKL